MKTSFSIGTIIGIPIKIHLTFLVIIALFVWVFAFQSISLPLFGLVIGYGALSLPLVGRILLALGLSILFFLGVLLHELAHSYTAQRAGYGVGSITLFIFGGISQMEEIPRDPKLELKIALAGPASSVAIGAAFLGGYFATTAFGIGSSLAVEVLAVTFGTLAFYNVVLGIFNLIPAFPTDGGRVLRALLATRTDYRTATQRAAAVGKGVAIVMGIFGLITFNFWFVLIAIFIYMGASQEARSTEVTLALDGLTVADIMTREVVTVGPDQSLLELAQTMEQHRRLGYPVVDDAGRTIGVVTFKHLTAVDRGQWPQRRIREIMHPAPERVAPDEDAKTAFETIMKNDLGRLLVTDDHGDLVGCVTRSDLTRAIQLRGLRA